jgi:hypothetical protein
LVVAGQPTQVQTWEKWKKVSTFQISQGLKRKESLNIPTFPGVEREGKKGGEKSRERGDGEKPKAGRKAPKAAATQCSSGDPDGGLVHGVHLAVGVVAPTGGLVHGVHLALGVVGVHLGVGAPGSNSQSRAALGTGQVLVIVVLVHILVHLLLSAGGDQLGSLAPNLQSVSWLVLGPGSR